jgi:hypothetical protein
MLTQAVGAHWHALVRDVLSLGYRIRDMFSGELGLAELVSVVVAAPPNSSLRYFLDQGWSREAHLLANMAEQRAGLSDLNEAYDRPGLADRGNSPNDGRIVRADVMTWAEMDKLDQERRNSAVGGVTTKKVW